MDPQVIKAMLGAWGLGTTGAIVGILATAAIFDNPADHPIAAIALPTLLSVVGQYYGMKFMLGRL